MQRRVAGVQTATLGKNREPWWRRADTLLAPLPERLGGPGLPQLVNQLGLVAQNLAGHQDCVGSGARQAEGETVVLARRRVVADGDGDEVAARRSPKRRHVRDTRGRGDVAEHLAREGIDVGDASTGCRSHRRRVVYSPAMLNVDEFESAFRAANKVSFRHVPPTVRRVLAIADLAETELDDWVDAGRRLLVALDGKVEWVVHGAGSWSGVEGVLRLVEETSPDLIVSYRNLNSDAWKWAYSLGVYLNALTRGTTVPVLVTPNPHAYPAMSWQHSRTDSVMVVNDSLTGDDALISWGAAIARPGGELHLTHMEHDEIFARYMDAISKIPEIDTDTARATLMAHLLKEPTEYIESAEAKLAEAGLELQVRKHVRMGHRVRDYRGLVEEHEVDVLVFPTLEEDRLALHGVAYSLAVELVSTPLLMV